MKLISQVIRKEAIDKLLVGSIALEANLLHWDLCFLGEIKINDLDFMLDLNGFTYFDHLMFIRALPSIQLVTPVRFV
jgi:hypothetical protein